MPDTSATTPSAPSTPAPIFVVGASRSGTSLLAAMLNAHSRIACGPESQLLNKLKPAALKKILTDPEWPKLAVERMGKVLLAEQRVIDLFDVNEEELRTVLQSRPPSIAALFDALIGTYAAKQHKPRWAEKTPRHLLHLDTLRAAYPEARIIRIVRDFRDSALSMCQLPWASREPLVNGYICCEWYEKTDEFFRRDGHSLTVQYETLVERPEQVLSQICDFIGEPFEPAMLDTRKAGAAVISDNEPWKQQVTGKLDKGRLFRWKSSYSAEQKAAFEMVAGRWLREFHYEVTQSPRQSIALIAFGRDLLELETPQITALANRGVALVYNGDPLTPQPAMINLCTGMLASNRRELWPILLKRLLKGHKTWVYVGDGWRSRAKRALLRGLFRVRVINRLSDLTVTVEN